MDNPDCSRAPKSQQRLNQRRTSHARFSYFHRAADHDNPRDFAILLFGVVGFRALPVAALPSVDYPTIQVTAAQPGANPETMASSVATPLEREFSTIAGVRSISSSNTQGGDDHHDSVCSRS